MNAVPFSAAHLKVACANCNLRELCLPVGMPAADLEKVEELVAVRHRVKRGENLFRAGDQFTSLFALRTGFFKSSVLTSDGREQVTGFHMTGELIGLDGISSNVHTCDTIALEDSDVCVIPYDRIEEIASAVPALRGHLHRVMSREIVREHSVMLLLGSMMAEERLATFLLNMSQRFEARGFSKSEFYLRMTRAEIGSFLGLKLETVSRALSHFAQQGLIAIDQKRVQIKNSPALHALVHGHVASLPEGRPAPS